MVEILNRFREFLRPRQPQIIKIDSTYLLSDLPTGLPCQLEDGGILIPQWVSNSNTASNRFTIEADRVPAWRCTVDGGGWFPAEVTLDLVEKTMSLLHGLGDDEGAEAMSSTREILEKIVSTNPSINTLRVI